MPLVPLQQKNTHVANNRTFCRYNLRTLQVLGNLVSFHFHFCYYDKQNIVFLIDIY